MTSIGLERTAHRLGNPSWLFEGTGLDPAMGKFPPIVTADVFFRFASNLLEGIDDPAFHLDLARTRVPAFHPDLALGMRHCATLAQGLELLVRFNNRAYAFTRYSIIENGTDYTVRLHPKTARSPIDFLLENGIANLVRHIRQFRGTEPEEAEVSFAHRPLFDEGLYLQALGCHTRFHAAHTQVTIPATWASETNLNYDPVIWFISNLRVDSEIGFFDRSGKVQALQVLIREMRGKDGKPPKLEEVARRSGLPPRSFNRVLQNEGTTFRELVETVQKNRARELLCDPQLPVSSISDMLGFSEQSSFGRSFRRWFGSSPSEFRNRFRP